MKRTSLLLAVATALLSTAASANVVGPGGGSGYVGAVKTVAINVPGIGTNYAVHPTYNGCVTALNQIIYTFQANPTLTIVQVIPCHYVPGSGGAVEVELPPMSTERIMQVLEGEQILRDRYNLDAYEAESTKLWEIPSGDGGH